MKKILAVDTVISFFENNRGFLNRAGFELYTARTGLEAVEIHRKERVNLIMADLQMPDIAGEKLCSLLRADSGLRHVSVVLACRDCPEEIGRARNGGANAWLTHPLQPERVLDLIGRLLEVSVRHGYRVLLKVTVNGAKETQSFLCSSKNISATGLLIETGEVLSDGDSITCSFFLPGSCQVTADGVIARSVNAGAGMYQYGIRFTGLDPRFREAIEQFIAGYLN